MPGAKTKSTCEVRSRLIDEWTEAVRHHSESLTNFSLGFAALEPEKRMTLMDEVERRRLVVEEATQALDAHRAHHN